MNWDSSRLLDALCYDLILSDFPRGQNRARILNLANGAPPYSENEVEENGIVVNVSDLTHTRLCHDARSQLANTFMKPGFYARAKTDGGSASKRSEYSSTVTREWNKHLKDSIRYYESRRAKHGSLVLHGIAPNVWDTEDSWCPKPLGVEDILVPGETLLGFENLPFIVIRRTFTGIELQKLTAREHRDPGWNMPFVDQIVNWLETQVTVLRSLNWPDVWAPERIEERSKESSSGSLAGDRAPKIDVFDIYAYDDSGDEEGWIRRMILDAWSEPGVPNPKPGDWNRKQDVMGDTSNFLFTSGRRKVARTWEQIAAFQFADLSARFPAHYYSVRSLGWMTYASCHLGNRLRCKFYESVLEALMMLYEVNDQTDAQNALKVNLINKGFIDKTIRPVKAGDRWQVNANLVELGLRDNQQMISQQSASWMQQQNFSADRTEKTRFQVMAELQAMTSLANAAMAQAYQYQRFEDKEVFRRFLNPKSKNPQVMQFRATCINKGVPESILVPEAWEVQPERVMGAGNKTLEMTIAEQLMAWRPMFDPEPQRDILRRGALALTDDSDLALQLVPEQPIQITSNVREAEHIAATLMQGIEVEPMTGENNLEIIPTLLKILGQRVQAAMQGGSMMEPKEIGGCQQIAKQIAQRIAMVAQDKTQQQIVKAFSDALTKLTNELKGFAQRAQKQMQQSQPQAGGPDGKDIAKMQAIQMQAQQKVQQMKESHASRTAQKKIAFEEKIKQDQQRFAMEMQQDAARTGAELEKNRLSSLGE